MATESAAVSVHNLLSGTTADLITIGTEGLYLAGFEVQKRSGSASLYFTYTMSTKAPTTAVAEANNTHQVVSIGEAVFIPLGGKQCSIVTVSIVGNANDYSIRAVYA